MARPRKALSALSPAFLQRQLSALAKGLSWSQGYGHAAKGELAASEVKEIAKAPTEASVSDLKAIQALPNLEMRDKAYKIRRSQKHYERKGNTEKAAQKREELNKYIRPRRLEPDTSTPPGPDQKHSPKKRTKSSTKRPRRPLSPEQKRRRNQAERERRARFTPEQRERRNQAEAMRRVERKTRPRK